MDPGDLQKSFLGPKLKVGCRVYGFGLLLEAVRLRAFGLKVKVSPAPKTLAASCGRGPPRTPTTSPRGRAWQGETNLALGPAGFGARAPAIDSISVGCSSLKHFGCCYWLQRKSFYVAGLRGSECGYSCFCWPWRRWDAGRETRHTGRRGRGTQDAARGTPKTGRRTRDAGHGTVCAGRGTWDAARQGTRYAERSGSICLSAYLSKPESREDGSV